jgi:hypothetical protein
MDSYYVLRRGKDFKVLYMDMASAHEWQAAGWEIYRQDNKEAAHHLMEMWKAGLWTPAAVRTSRAA